MLRRRHVTLLSFSGWAVTLTAAGVVAGSGCWFFAPTSLDGFVEAVIRAQCHFDFACCTPAERAERGGSSARDEGTCVAEALEEDNGGNLVIDRAKAVVAAGKGTFNSEQADTCMKPLLDANNNCQAQELLSGEIVLDDLCAALAARAFVEGNVGDGDDCNDDIECESFGFCDQSDNDPNVLTTSGKCVASREEGDECIDEDFNVFPCFPGTSCQPDGATSTCQENERLPDGDPCFAGSQCESNFCGNVTVRECAFTPGQACAVDEDCPNAAIGETCNERNELRCTENDLEVEICDGQ